MRADGEWGSILGAVAIMLLPVVIISRSPVVLLAEAALGFAIVLVALGSAASALRDAQPSPFETALRDAETAQARPADLERIERLITYSRPGRRDRDQRVATLLRAAIARRLADRHAVDLQRQPLAARRLLGEELYELAREPDDATGTDPLGSLDARALLDVTTRLEAI